MAGERSVRQASCTKVLDTGLTKVDKQLSLLLVYRVLLIPILLAKSDKKLLNVPGGTCY